MGDVYLAEDTRLGRKVALKLLPAELTKDPDRVRRFVQEAKAASALNHPNIITIHDIGECEAGHFLVMELVAGRPVSAIIPRVYGMVGGKDEAQKILEELIERSKQEWVAPYLMATAYISLNQRDHAFEWLQKALDDYDEWIGCLRIDPALDELRSDHRFEDLLRRM